MSREDRSTKRAPNQSRRDEDVHRAILAATVELLESGGYKKLTIEAIAAKAGAGKQTIYRWWPSKAALVMEAYIGAADVRSPGSDTGNLIADLESILVPVFKQNEQYDRGTALAVKSMMAEAQLDAEFRQTFLHLIRSWHEPLVRALERGKARGELRADADTNALVDMMLGASWYRVLLEHAPLNADFARLIARTIVQGSR